MLTAEWLPLFLSLLLFPERSSLAMSSHDKIGCIEAILLIHTTVRRKLRKCCAQFPSHKAKKKDLTIEKKIE